MGNGRWVKIDRFDQRHGFFPCLQTVMRLNISRHADYLLTHHPSLITLRPSPIHIVLLDPFSVFAADYAPHPFGIVQIPAHGLADAGLESLSGLPAEFLAAFRCIDRIASIVSRPVG